MGAHTGGDRARIMPLGVFARNTGRHSDEPILENSPDPSRVGLPRAMPDKTRRAHRKPFSRRRLILTSTGLVVTTGCALWAATSINRVIPTQTDIPQISASEAPRPTEPTAGDPPDRATAAPTVTLTQQLPPVPGDSQTPSASSSGPVPTPSTSGPSPAPSPAPTRTLYMVVPGPTTTTPVPGPTVTVTVTVTKWKNKHWSSNVIPSLLP